jgi:hypothetical protein
MAAGLGFKTFTTGEVLTAADVNGYLMQGLLVFANAAARDAAITSPQEGQACYLKDTDAVLTYSGSAWVGFDDSNAIQNTIVDAKGDLIAASAADTPARLAVGNNGETLVADSAATVGLRYSATPSASNPVINSAFQIAQRGTSFALTGSGIYTLDRWYADGTGSGRTISRQTTGDTTNLPNIQYCARIARDSGNTATNSVNFTTPFETVNSVPFAGKAITLSFYARAGANFSAASSQITVQLKTGTGTDQNVRVSYTGEATPINSTATLTTTWQRFSYNGTIASTATEIQPLFNAAWSGTAGAADYVEITGVQIDIGSVALPFRTNGGTLQGELAACQRYFSRTSVTNGQVGFANGMVQSATSTFHNFWGVPLRVSPTTTINGTLRVINGNSDFAVTAINNTYWVAGNQSTTVNFTVASGMTAGQASMLYASTTGVSLDLSAEL